MIYLVSECQSARGPVTIITGAMPCVSSRRHRCSCGTPTSIQHKTEDAARENNAIYV